MHFLIYVLVACSLGLQGNSAEGFEDSLGSVHVKMNDLTSFLLSPSFDPQKFNQMWLEYHGKHVKLKFSQPHEWKHKLDRIMEAAVASNNPLCLETVLGLSINELDSVFDPNTALFRVLTSRNLDEMSGSQMARILVEFGASPLMTGLTNDPEMARLTSVELSILLRKPKVLEAFLGDPSPISYKSLEQLANDSPRVKRGIEVFRTAIVRTMRLITLEERLNTLQANENIGETNVESMKKILEDENFYIFSRRYLNMLMIFLAYFVLIALIIGFLYHCRVKEVPHPETLMRPRDDGGSFASYFYISISIFVTGAPGSTFLEIIAYAIGSIGSVIWSLVWTARDDLALSLLIATAIQSLFTEICYLSYAPKMSSTELELVGLQEKPTNKLMYYSRGSDRGRALAIAGVHLAACAVTTIILYAILIPAKRMYFCPTISISDTYGFPYTLTRAVAFSWDIIIFFMMSIRVYRVFDTFIVFGIFKRMMHHLTAPEPPVLVQDERMVQLTTQTKDKDSS